MYNKLFDVLYSDRLTEDVKLLVLEKLDLDLNEGADELSPYVSYINTLINTNITSEALEEVLDMTFSGLSEEEIDKITEEFIRASVEAYIAEAAAPIGLVGVRKEAARREAAAVNKPKADRPIGLAGVRKAAAQAEDPKPAPKNNEFKGPSAMDRLKSAATKVKNFASKATSKVKEVAGKAKEAAGKAKDWATKNLKPKTHVEKLQQQKDDRVKKAVEMGTGSKDEPETKQLKMDFNASADNTPAPEKKDENKRTVTLSRGKNRRLAIQKLKDKVEGKQAEEVSTPPENKNTEATSSTAVDSGKPANNKKRGRSTRKTTIAKLRDSAKNAATGGKKNTNGGKKNTSGGKKKANEALAEVICLLADTNISESILEFVIDTVNEGKVFNEQNRVKVVEKKKGAYEEALKKLDQAVEKGARTHTDQVTPAMVDRAEHAGLSYETAKANTEHKYGHKID